MTHDWDELFGDVDGAPITGATQDFEEARDRLRKLETDVSLISSDFKKLQCESPETMEGKAAVALAEVIASVSSELAQVVPFAREVGDILDGHASSLREYHGDAKTALAKARLRWDAKDKAETDQRDSVKALLSIKSQLEDLRYRQSISDQDLNDQIDRIERTETDAEGRLRRCKQTLSTAEDNLQKSRNRWGELREDETELNRVTCEQLGAVDLGGLQDPHELKRLLGEAVKLYVKMTLLDDIWKTLHALAEGRFMDALWHFKDLLTEVLLGLSLVMIFATGGLALLVFATVVAVVALAATIVLFVTEHPHPETGKSATVTDLVFAAIDVATAGIGTTRLLKARPVSSYWKAPLPTKTAQVHLKAFDAQQDVAQRARDLNRLGDKLSDPFRYTTGSRANRAADSKAMTQASRELLRSKFHRTSALAELEAFRAKQANDFARRTFGYEIAERYSTARTLDSELSDMLGIDKRQIEAIPLHGPRTLSDSDYAISGRPSDG